MKNLFVKFVNNFFDSFYCPINLLFGNNQRRSKANDCFVCIFAEKAFFLKFQHVWTSLLIKNEADPETFSTYLFDMRRFNSAKFFYEIST